MNARDTRHPSRTSRYLTVSVGMYEMGVDDVRRPPIDLLEQAQDQHRIHVVPRREARHLDTAFAHRVHELIERPGAEHQHLCLDAALDQRRQQLEEMALRACDLPVIFWTCRTRIRDVRPATGTSPVTPARPSWPGSPTAGDDAEDRIIGITAPE